MSQSSPAAGVAASSFGCWTGLPVPCCAYGAALFRPSAWIPPAANLAVPLPPLSVLVRLMLLRVKPLQLLVRLLLLRVTPLQLLVRLVLVRVTAQQVLVRLLLLRVTAQQRQARLLLL